MKNSFYIDHEICAHEKVYKELISHTDDMEMFESDADCVEYEV